MAMRDLANFVLDVSGLRDIARSENTYYETPTNNYLVSIGKTDVEIGAIGDVYKHAFTALSETYNIGLSPNYPTGVGGAYQNRNDWSSQRALCMVAGAR